MRVLVVGAGAIGSVVAGLLARAGNEVWLLGRAWHLDPICACHPVTDLIHAKEGMGNFTELSGSHLSGVERRDVA